MRRTSRGAATPTGSWRRWCAGSRPRPTSTSRPPPIASIAPISIAPPRAKWASTAPPATACRRAAMANRPCRQSTTDNPWGLPFRRGQMANKKTSFGRRDVLKGATATAALMAAARASFPSGAFAQSTGPETNKVTLGFIALTDAAPLIIAKEKKIFDKYGITDANIAKQASWGTTRDNMVLGSAAGGIDGAHILTPKPYQITMGTTTAENKPTPMYILCRLNYDCQAISVAKEFKGSGVTVNSGPLKEVFAKKKAAGKEVKCAMTFPGGTHDVWIRYWLAAAGIDPDKDVSTIVVPPPQMVANMKVGSMEAFCVGEPWNEQLVNQGVGFSACMTGEIWKDHPEKSLGMRADWVDKNPKAAMAVLMATMEAQQWCEKMENKDELATIIGKRQWFNVPPADIINRIKGDIEYGDGRSVKRSD